MSNETDKNISNLASSMSALTKQMEKMSAQQLLQNKNINDQKKDFEDIIRNSKKIEDSYEEQGNLLQRTTKYLGEIGGSLKNTLSSTIKLGSTISSIGTTMFAANIIKDMIDLDNKMTALSVRMGKGHDGIKELKTSVTDLQKEFGTSYENASNLISELAKDKYVGNIKEAAAGIDLFSRATDVSRSAVLELTNNLSKSGGLGTDSINAIYASMLKTQQVVGISDKGMNALVETINDMTMNMVAFGKTDKEIKQMAVQTTALVGAFEKVGISAAKTTKLVNQLTDPDNIENNIMLYSQLGVSIEDALSGDIDIGALDGQFKEMADRIVQMGPIAGSQFAKSMGLSYKEVTKMAKVEAGAAEEQIEKALTPEEQALETMKTLEKNTEGIGKRLEAGLNKLEGKIKGLPTLLLVGAAFLFPLLVKKGKQLFHKIFDKKEVQASVMDAVVPAIENSVKKAGGIVKGQATKAGNTLKGNIGQWFDSTTIGGFFNGIDKRVDALVARAKKESFADKFLGATKKNALDDVDARLTKIDSQKEKIFSGLGDVGIKNPTYDEKSGNLIIDKTNLDKNQLKVVNALEESYNKINATQIALEKRKSKLITKDMAMQKVAEATAILEEKKSVSSQAIRANLEGRKKDKQRELDIDVEIARLEKEKDGMSIEGQAAMNAKIKSLKTEKDQIERIAKKREEAAKAARAEAAAAEATAKAAKDTANSMKPEKISGLSKIFEGVKTNISTAFSHTTLGKNLAEREGQGAAGKLKAVGKTAVGFAGKAGKGALKGIGKGFGKIMKSLGPMAIVASIVGKLLSKIQEPLNVMIDQIINNLSPVITALLPAIEALVNVIAKHILPPVLIVLSGILKVVNVILKHTLIPLLKFLGEVFPGLKGAMDGISDVIEKATGTEVTDALVSAANSLSTNGANMEKSSDKMADSADKMAENSEPSTISATGTSFVISNGYTDPSSKANERMTSVTNQDANDSMKNYQNEKAQKENSESLNNISKNSNMLVEIYNIIKETGKNLSNHIENVFEAKPGNYVVEGEAAQ